MPVTYSTWEAKTKFSEIVRKVRQGQRVYVSYRGERVAEIRPIDESVISLDERLESMGRTGTVSRARRAPGSISRITRKPGR